MNLLILPAIMTGVFCAVFAMLVGFITEALTMSMVLGVSFVSGFLGNLFAQWVTGKSNE
ncbi:hypothetical protein PGB28_10195 [Primorskyibacter aestuariivivens]|uniref:hypothetical protein n=1 Tax=Primorskyibacter aestuariivivens TaxID=1888912 RepID=UPI00230188A1|nr:hypothetical protein [Primorskyibacter aestuariivivens]MDA7428831.1 hypothetical protein [Primorskyibacter aestuariivivens]